MLGHRHPCMYRNPSSRFRSSQRVSKRPTFLELLTASKKKIPLSKFMSITKAKRYVPSHLLLYSHDLYYPSYQRRLSLVWANYTLRSTLNECDGNTIQTVLLESPGLLSERLSLNAPIFPSHIRNKREERVNMPKLRVSLSRWNWIQKLEKMLSSSR